jgi:2-hydroxycyclohexanecarboxyl-CoA dehydrogenase
MDLELENKSIVITGGASNIGRAITLGFAAEGANITMGDIDMANAKIVAEKAKAAGAAAVKVVECDVTNLDAVKSLFAQAVDQHGTVDVFVNSVGWDEFKFFTQTTPELWQKIIQINYVGTLNCTFAALEIMAPKGSGAIVSLSSDASRQGEPREAVYGGVKAGINGFMKTIAKEHGRDGIRCNVVCPGVTLPEDLSEIGANSLWADMDSLFTAEQLEKVARALPLRKLGRPRDVANAVLFLSSNAVAGHVTGQVLSVSGGYTMIG